MEEQKMNELPEMSEEIPEKDLPTLVDNSGNFPSVEKETSPALTRPAIPDNLVYPKRGDILYFAGQRFAVTQELRRHRFVIKWRG
jgi:hypothetical protein